MAQAFLLRSRKSRAVTSFRPLRDAVPKVVEALDQRRVARLDAGPAADAAGRRQTRRAVPRALTMAALVLGDMFRAAPPFDRELPAPIRAMLVPRRLGRHGHETGKRDVGKDADHEIGERASPHFYWYRIGRGGL